MTTNILGLLVFIILKFKFIYTIWFFLMLICKINYLQILINKFIRIYKVIVSNANKTMNKMPSSIDVATSIIIGTKAVNIRDL